MYATLFSKPSFIRLSEKAHYRVFDLAQTVPFFMPTPADLQLSLTPQQLAVRNPGITPLSKILGT